MVGIVRLALRRPMSRQMVEHYMRFKDQIGIAAAGHKRLQLVNKDR